MKTPTMREIAAVAGVHHSTLSRALNNHPGIPLKRRQELQALAKKMGYVRDPVLGALIAYRTGKRPQGFQSVIAWLVPGSQHRDWKRHKAYVDYFEGATARAQVLGFGLEEVPLATVGGNMSRITSVLIARNIQNIIVGPSPVPGAKLNEIKWEHFCAVRIGYSLASPQLNIVTANHFQAMTKIWEEAIARGYRRPGLYLTDTMDKRINYGWSGSFLRHQLSLPEQDRVSPYLEAEYSQQSFLKWFDSTRPDVIIAPSDTMILPTLKEKRNLTPPQDIGFIGLTELSLPHKVTGIKESSFEIGMAAVNLVVAMYHRREFGIPQTYQTTLIENGWADNASTR